MDGSRRLDNARSGNSATGLGLAIFKEIVERHPGTVAVHQATPTAPILSSATSRLTRLGPGIPLVTLRRIVRQVSW
ncbi:MAG: cell wall metabolism sensor histidine kinase WalK [Actinomycetota bacterium]|nr:cell wall metabolism sensor histidine kinase WalK [Actinomycetota bacterium]